MRKQFWLPLVVFLACALPAATFAQRSESLTGRFDPKSYIDLAGIWRRVVIPVCWTAPGDDTGARGWVRRVIEAVVEPGSGPVGSRYTFTGWGNCAANARDGIRITIADAGANSEVGFQMERTALGGRIPRLTEMRLNFTFLNWSQGCADPRARRNCIEVIAVHEFLHALGFLHEQLHPDLVNSTAPEDLACRTRLAEHIRGDARGRREHAYTSYDRDSIVNYCRDMYAEPARLSAKDQETLVFMRGESARLAQQR